MVRLEREQLVDDDLYARQWARQRITSQRKGKMWVRQELRQKGISKASIGEALGEITDNEEWESALTIGRKKWNQVRGDIMEKKENLPFSHETRIFGGYDTPSGQSPHCGRA